MRKSLLLVLLIISLLTWGCSSSSPSATGEKKNAIIKVGATAIPHAEVLNHIKPALSKEGIDLEVVEMADYVRPNLAVAEKELDGNYFQHLPYLEKFAADHNLQLAAITKVHIEPMGIYSSKVKSLADVENGAIVAIPNDPTNGGRALLLLESSGLIALNPEVGITATLQDITDNPKSLSFVELEAPQLPRSFDDVTLSIINTNYALDAKLNPSEDALFIESADSPYVNIFVVREGDQERPEIQKISQALNSDSVRDFIKEKYQGAIVPAF